ncbi:hypothetical protein ACQ86N_10505 [Puia sp. P3]
MRAGVEDISTFSWPTKLGRVCEDPRLQILQLRGGECGAVDG